MKHDDAAKSFLIALGISALILSSSLFLSAARARGAPAPRAPAITDQLRIGSEFFLNRTETKESVQRHFRIMHENGLTLVRIFVIWDDIERTPDDWDLTGYDWIYDAAAESGIKIVATLCAEDPPGWVGKTTFYHNRTNLNDPEIRKHAAVYIEKVVNRYKNHPAQGVWLLMNEPTKYDTEPATLRAFGDWLQAKYGNVAELNRHWFRPLSSFSEVQVPPEQLSNYWTDYHAVVNWREFNIDNLVNQLLWIKERIRTLIPTTQLILTLRLRRGGPMDKTFGRRSAWSIFSALQSTLPGSFVRPQTRVNTASASPTGLT